MKNNKVITIFLGCALVVSVSLNFYLFLNLSKTKGQITGLQEQLSDLETLRGQEEELQRKLAESEGQIKILEDSLAEMQESAALDDDTAFDGNGGGADISIPADFPYVDKESEQPAVGQQQPQQEQQQSEQQPQQQQQQPQQPVNPMPTYSGEFERNDSGIGTGEGANGHFGTFE